MEIILLNVRGAFPEVFEPKPFNGEGNPRCTLQALISREDTANFNLVQNAIVAVAKEKWPDKYMDILKSLKAKGDLCLHDGDEKSQYAGFAGNWFVSASNEARPVVCDRGRRPLTAADGLCYSGAHYNVKVDVWAQDNKYGKRVNAKLLVVQWVGHGEAFAGGSIGRAEDMPDMDATEGTTSAPTSGEAINLFA